VCDSSGKREFFFLPVCRAPEDLGEEGDGEMRYARLKPEHTELFVHLYNRVAGSAGDFSFEAAEYISTP
jgi:hypothetical protein